MANHIRNCAVGIAIGTLVGFSFSAAIEVPLGDNPTTDHVMYKWWSALLTLICVPLVAALFVLLGAKIFKCCQLDPFRLMLIAYSTLVCPVCGPAFGAGTISTTEFIITISLMGFAGGAMWGFFIKPIKSLPMQTDNTSNELKAEGK